MTHLETIIELLDKMPNLCDDCISKELGITPRQTVRAICEQAKTISKSYGEGGCFRCGKNKILRVVGDGSVVAGNVRVKSIKRSFMRQSHPDCYSREKDLANRFNRAVIEVLKIQDKDYYAEMKSRTS